MKLKLYNLIKEKPLQYNSVELGKIFNITPDEIRSLIKEINEDYYQYEYGIISQGNTYKLATEGQDFKDKVMYYEHMHKTAVKGKKLWLKRQDRISMGTIKQDGWDSAGEIDFEISQETKDQVANLFGDKELIKQDIIHSNAIEGIVIEDNEGEEND